MKLMTLIETFVITLSVPLLVIAKIRDTRHSFIARQRRFLIYQEGVNWVQMVIGIGFPVELRQESITWGATLKSYYLLPTNSSDILNPSLNIERKERSPSRWEIYSALRQFIERFNLGNGKTCLMRAICEAAFAPFDEKTGLLAEIMNVLLIPSTTIDSSGDYTDIEYHAAEKFGRTSNDCTRLFHECDFNFVQQLLKFL